MCLRQIEKPEQWKEKLLEKLEKDKLEQVASIGRPVPTVWVVCCVCFGVQPAAVLSCALSGR